MNALSKDVTNCTLYHYTSMDAAFSIIDSKSLRLSNIRFSNDGNEFLYGLKMFRKIAGESALPLVENMIPPFWFTSFSMNGDDFAQWQIYGDLGRGVCLGFDADSLNACAMKTYRDRAMLAEIEYDESMQEAFLKGKYTELHTTQFSDGLNYALCCIKQNAFASEREVRLWLELQAKYSGTNPAYSPEILNRGGRLRPYLTMPLDLTALRSIRLGPQVDYSLNRKVLQIFVDRHGLEPEIDVSSIEMN